MLRTQKSRSSFAENSEQVKTLSLKLGVGQNTALRASPFAKNFAFIISAFSFHSISFFPSLLPTRSDVCQDSESDFHLVSAKFIYINENMDKNQNHSRLSLVT